MSVAMADFSKDCPPVCRTCGCGGDWHYRPCPVGAKRGDTAWLIPTENAPSKLPSAVKREPHIYTRAHDCKPVVFLPLMTKPAKSPFEWLKFLPDMWKPSDG